MKRVLQTSIVFVLCIGCMLLFSCTNAGDDTEIIPEYSTEYESTDADFHEYEYIIRAATHGSEYPLNPTTGDSAEGDKILQRYKEAEETFNIRIKPLNGADMGIFAVHLASGVNYGDLMLLIQNHVTQNQFVQKRYFNSYTQMGLDFSTNMYGSENALAANTVGGEVYGILAYYWNIPVSDTTPAMWFNPVVLSKFGQASPHELDENGEWTWDTFRKICEEVRNVDSTDPNMNTYAVCYTNGPYLELAAIFSNNGRFVEMQEDGRLKYALNSPNVLEALDFIRDLAERRIIVDGGDRQNIEAFVQDRQAFFLEYTHLAASSESRTNLTFLMDHAYEWINFPKGPRADDSMVSAAYSYWSRFFYSPITSDMEMEAAVIPFLFRPLPGDTEETFLNDFRIMNFYTDESFEYFLNIRENAFCDYSSYASGSVLDVLPAITKGQKSASEALNAMEESIQAQLDTLYNNYLTD